jgi:hypothetical protein
MIDDVFTDDVFIEVSALYGLWVGCLAGKNGAESTHNIRSIQQKTQIKS